MIYGAQVTPRLSTERRGRGTGPVVDGRPVRPSVEPRTIVYIDDVLRIAAKAVSASPLTVQREWTWVDGVPVLKRSLTASVCGKCTNPQTREFYSRHTRPAQLRAGGKQKPMTVILNVRCRHCGWCKTQRRNAWAVRALTEFGQASRTWFVTLTLRPEEAYRFLTLARMQVGDLSTDGERLFSAYVRVLGPELTKFIKRVRKNSGAPIRYIAVAEPHKSGVPHFHILMHEVDENRPLLKRHINVSPDDPNRPNWPLGFSNVKLADDARSVWYLCKYLAKDVRTRIRASVFYGKQNPSVLHNTLTRETGVEEGKGRGTPEKGLDAADSSVYQSLYHWTETGDIQARNER